MFDHILIERNNAAVFCLQLLYLGSCSAQLTDWMDPMYYIYKLPIPNLVRVVPNVLILATRGPKIQFLAFHSYISAHRLDGTHVLFMKVTVSVSSF